MRLRCLLGAPALLLAFAFAAPAAHATTIDFDSPTAAGSPALNGSFQPYDTQGIDFVEPYTQDVPDPASFSVPNCPPYLYATAAAHAGETQVLADGCPDEEHLSEPTGWLARLHDSARNVSLFAGGEPGLTATLTGYDFSGKPIPGATASAKLGATVDTPLAISASGPSIDFISVGIADTPAARSSPPLMIDDLTFDNPGGGTPEILLSVPGANDSSVCADGFQGAKTSCPATLERFNGANNAVTVAPAAATPLPKWLTLTGGTSVPGTASSTSLAFSVAATAPVPATASFTLTGTASGAPSVTIAPVNMEIGSAADFYLDTNYSYGDTFDLVAGAGYQSLLFDLTTTGVPAGGKIKFTASGLPTGVTAKFSPATISDTPIVDKTIKLSLKAAPTAPPVSNVKATVTGTMIGSPPVTPQTWPIRVTVTTFDLRAQGIEVTQGTQLDFGQLIPSGVPNPASASIGSYSPSDYGQNPAATGVDLAADKKTVVRFFGDAYGAPQGVPGTTATLTGYRGGTKLGTLFPDYGTPKTLTDTGEPYPAPVYDYPERVTNTNAFTFTLPRSWTLTNGDTPSSIQLVAKVYPPPEVPDLTGGAPISYTQECGLPSCPDNTYILDNVEFEPTTTLTVNPLELTSNGQAPGSVTQAFADLSAVTPLADDGISGLLLTPYPYAADISTTVNQYGATPSPNQQAVISWEGLGPVQSYESGSGVTNAIGVGADPRIRGITQVPSLSCSVSGSGSSATLSCTGSPPSCGPLSCFFGSYDNPTTGGPSIVTFNPSSPGALRPLTSVSHEMFHQFGLMHASACNGAGAVGTGSESWPPDQAGHLNGIALNVTSEPYVIIATGVLPGGKVNSPPSAGPIAHDLMSYCASIGFGDPGDWVSPRNWEALFAEFAVPPSGYVPAARDPDFLGAIVRASAAHPPTRASSRLPQALAALHPKLLQVVGFEDQYGLYITSVGPVVGPPRPNPTNCSACLFRLIARDRGGAILSSVRMFETGGHVDPIGDVVGLEADVPSANVASVEMTSPTGQTATRSRPAKAPRVRVLALAPFGVAVGGDRRVRVRWHSTNPEHLRAVDLTAYIDYSTDGGRRWRPIYSGPDSGHASLPSFFFAPSRDARVRVRVNDGFNETAAVSPRFVARDPRPQVAILTPIAAPGHRIAARLDGDAVIQLTGVAFDAGLHELRGTRLRWYDDGSFLGSGNTLLTGPLPPGVNRIGLIARDAHGQTGVAHAIVIVSRPQLPFLRLNFRHVIPPRARRLRIVASSPLPVTLTVGTSTVQLAPGHAQLLRLPVRPGAAPLVLHCTVQVDGLAIPFAARVRRA